MVFIVVMGVVLVVFVSTLVILVVSSVWCIFFVLLFVTDFVVCELVVLSVVLLSFFERVYITPTLPITTATTNTYKLHSVN